MRRSEGNPAHHHSAPRPLVADRAKRPSSRSTGFSLSGLKVRQGQLFIAWLVRDIREHKLQHLIGGAHGAIAFCHSWGG